MASAALPRCPCVLHYINTERGSHSISYLAYKDFKRKCLGHVSKKFLSQKVLFTFFQEKNSKNTMTSTVLRPLHISGHGSPTPTECKCFIEVTSILIKQLSVSHETKSQDSTTVSYINTPNKCTTGRWEYLTHAVVCLLNKTAAERTRDGKVKNGRRDLEGKEG